MSNLIRFKQFPEEIKLLSMENNGLKQALNRLAKGSSPTPRSWFFEHKSPEWILKTVESKLNGMKDLKGIADWDLSKSDKFGPQGGSAPLKDRLEGFEEYFAHLDSPLIVKDPLWKKAKLKAISLLGFNESGSPISSKAVIDRGLKEDKLNTSSGYPLWIKRKNPEAIESALQGSEHCIRDRYPCVLGTRASMGKTGTKARSIFMASMAVNVHGQRYQQPLQDYVRSRGLDFFLPWEGWDATQIRISQAWDSSSLKVGADYTKMDQHFNYYHGREVYDVIKHYFKKEHWDALESTIAYVFHVPIITNLGYVDQPHAMPSGSEWTNFLETVWNFIFIQYLQLKYHLDISLACGIGDDQLWILRGKWSTQKSVEWIRNVIVKEFEYAGLPGNPEKQEISLNETGFLQRLLTSEWSGRENNLPGAGVYSLVRNVTSQVYPEFYHNDKNWDHNQFALRVIMIAENACNHPLFDWYVKEFIAKSNSNVLDFVRLKDSEIRDIEAKSKTIANFAPTYNQEKQNKSILSFETFKLLRQIT